ncbi:MAG: hypothetical protein J0I09_00165 [Sphingobacteriia bacterium]|nr:hypothetical protein [Sphingobacteriia bacterium]
MDEIYFNKRFGRTIPGLLKTDRAALYANQQINVILKELRERSTKSIGDTYYSITRLRHDLIPIFRMSGDLMLSEKIIELTSDIAHRTPKEIAIAKLVTLAKFFDEYTTVEEDQMVSLKEKIDRLEQQLFEKNMDDDSTAIEEIDIEDASTVFVIMPFNKEFNDVWKGAIEKASKAEGYKALRVDMINKSSNITDDIIESIRKCKIAIVDVSSNNANVMFELGYAVALEKPNIIISQSVEFLPFDIRNIRTILYQNSWSGIEELKIKIQEFLKEYKPKGQTNATPKKRAARK